MIYTAKIKRNIIRHSKRKIPRQLKWRSRNSTSIGVTSSPAERRPPRLSVSRAALVLRAGPCRRRRLRRAAARGAQGPGRQAAHVTFSNTPANVDTMFWVNSCRYCRPTFFRIESIRYRQGSLCSVWNRNTDVVSRGEDGGSDGKGNRGKR